MLQTCDLTATHAAADMCGWSTTPVFSEGVLGWPGGRSGKGANCWGGVKEEKGLGGGTESLSTASMISLLSRGGEMGVTVGSQLNYLRQQ